MKTKTSVSPRRWARLNLQNLNDRKPLASRNDRAEHRASDLLRFSAGAERVEIAVDVAKNTMTATAMPGNIDRATSPGRLLRVRERARMAKTILPQRKPP